MFPSIFTDELGLDIADALPIIQSWGLTHIDLRSRVFGKGFERITPEQAQSASRIGTQKTARIMVLHLFLFCFDPIYYTVFTGESTTLSETRDFHETGSRR